MARYHVLTVGRPRAGWAQQAVDDYSKRLRRHGGVDERAVKVERFRGDEDSVRRAESERVLAAASGRLVVLDERGEQLDTDGFTALVDKGRQQGPLTFALGGAYGHHALARDGGWRTVALSRMVLNHELARVVLYEQLYRAVTRIEGIPYHH